MAMKTGLRTEIVVSTVLLLAAALLFAGFLLVKLTEHELLEERRLSLQRTALLLAAADPAPAAISSLLTSVARNSDLVAWRFLGSDLSPLMSFAMEPLPPLEEMPSVPPMAGEVSENLRYSSAWNPFGGTSPSYLDLSVRTGEAGANVLQLRFSLASLVAQVHRSQRLILVYVILYGAVLSGFGIYVLNRNVVEPVRRLRAATAGVAAGDLEPIAVARGPGEISELADDFNSMVKALQTSRAETAAHIGSLEEANLALRQARDEVVRAEKMASVGHLAAGMAHEIGNPLAAVIGYLNLLRGELADPGQKDLLERSLLEAARIDRLVRDLLDYAAPVLTCDEPFDPLGAVRDAVALLVSQGAIDEASVNDRAPAALGLVRMDRGHFVQVWVNLLINARDATPAGGEIIFDAACSGSELVLSLADNGAGIPAELLPRIFEPFYTTKDPGKGRGLGLAVCQRLISAAGGRIEVRSAAGQGSTFSIYLPVAREDS